MMLKHVAYIMEYSLYIARPSNVVGHKIDVVLDIQPLAALKLTVHIQSSRPAPSQEGGGRVWCHAYT